jgi:hypothetical protein
MAIIKKFSSYQNLSNFNVLVNDTNPNSDYFRITKLEETLTGGKNAFLIEGSPFLKETTEVKIEILDVDGTPIYYEPGDGIPEYYEGLSKVVAIYVYPDTPIGLGKITILGEAKQYIDRNGILQDVTDPQWVGAYNVKWEKNFQINRNLQNETIVRFYKRPQVNITEIVKPIFNKTIPLKTISGSVSGEPIQPGTGTNLTTWGAGTVYRLTKSDGSWDKDIDENPIRITVIKDVNGNILNNETGSIYTASASPPQTIATQSVFTPTIIEVLNNSQVLVDFPYTVNNLVRPFTSESFVASYLDFDNETPGESSLTGSFAKIDLTQLKTFAGDVARVKIYRRSRNEVGDFQFVQESRLESTELLRDITVSDAVEIPYGNFSDDVLDTYWITSSVLHPTTVDSSVLSQAVKVDFDNQNSGSVQRLITSQSFNISKDVEYELSFKTLLSGSATNTNYQKYLKAYLTGSFINTNNQETQFTQSFVFISGSGIFNTRQNVSQNILAERDITASLAFEFKGDDWYLSQVSLKNAQETSFSPDEFTLVQSIPRKLEKETFDFRFEFYDINNNYIPVDVTATKEFDGGNDYLIGGTSAKILTFESDRNAFRYADGEPSPTVQTILLQATKTNLTGSILYTSQAFDQGGTEISDTDWTVYPGLLTFSPESPSGQQSTLTVSNFEGNWNGTPENKPEVYSIIYTAECEDLQEFETIFRVEDGDNAPQLLVTSNANQFIYEPTTLSPKPSGQSITIRAQRKNLEGLDSDITIFATSDLGSEQLSGSAQITSLGHPDISGSVTLLGGGVTEYTISALQFSQSFASNSFDEVTYIFFSNDVFGNPQSDQITISKVVNFDGISLVLSNESVTFPAYSDGTVFGGFEESSGSVQMFIGGNQIEHIDGLFGQKNAFDIISASGQNVIPTDDTPNTSNYSISDMTADSGSLILDIRYIAGDSSTSQSFQKIVTYTKSKRGVPNVEVAVTPSAQSIEANSLGNGTSSPQTLTITALEGSTNRFTSIGSITSSGGLTPVNIPPSNLITFTDTVSDMISDTETITIPVNYTDGEGNSGIKTVVATISRVRKAPPTTLVVVNPQSQTIDSGSNAAPIDVLVTEGSTVYNLGSGNQTFSIGTPSGPFQVVGGSIFANPINPEDTISGTAIISYTNSEGVNGSQPVSFTVGVTRQGENGVSGSDGEPGVTGPGVVFRGPWDPFTSYAYEESIIDNIGRRDAVIHNDVYYATIANNLNKEPGVAVDWQDYWEELGADSFFVAAEIIISRNSFVEEVLNVGQRAGNANIAIVGGDNQPYISIGQGEPQVFGNNGIFTGIVSGTGVLSLVSNTNSLTWDGSNLTVSGSINATDGTIGGFTIGDHTLTTTNFTIGDSTQTYALNASNNFTVTHVGDVEASNINITGGGINIDNVFVVENDGAVTATNISITGGPTSGNVISINGDGTVFTVDSDGKLTATGAEITGTINAEDGTIGGWTIGETTISSGDIVLDSANGEIDAGLVKLVSNEIQFDGSGQITFTGLGNISAGVDIIGNSVISFSSRVYSNQGATFLGGFYTRGNVVVNDGTLVIEKPEDPFSILTSGGIAASENISTSSNLVAGGDAQIDGNVQVGGNVVANGNVIAFSSSDKQLKNNIKPLTNSLDKIIKIGGYEFDWDETKQDDFKGNDVGVIAQEIQEVLPQVVTKQKDGYLAVKYEKIVPLLIEGMKELNKKIEDLEKQIFKLKG